MMATILCLETATPNCSVALAVDGELIALQEDGGGEYNHSEKLHVYIEDILRKSAVDKSRLDAIAVSKGPGSYTGLRIGVSAAKGLCYALDLPLISIPTLYSLANSVDKPEGLIVPMIDAKRMEVYAAVYRSDYSEEREILAEVLNENSYLEYLEDQKVTFLGSGVEKFSKICDHPNAIFLFDRLPSAKEMCYPSFEKYKKSDIEDVAYFEPFYLKDFVTTN